MYADGLLVMQNGTVLYEFLVEGVPAWRTHGINSASKVFTGCVAAILADQGKLSWDQPLHEYAPQLKGTGETPRSLQKDVCLCFVFLASQDASSVGPGIPGHTPAC